jgi:hypothetical protein
VREREREREREMGEIKVDGWADIMTDEQADKSR